jgi:CheY-like chemotaxis protein
LDKTTAHEESVLIVDDDAAIRDALTSMLEEEGHRAVSAENGAVAMERLREGLRPCAILLDLMMPVMDGWDFRAMQRRDPALADIPIIVITAVGFRTDTILTQFGAVECVHKPPPPSALLDAVRRHCLHAQASA